MDEVYVLEFEWNTPTDSGNDYEIYALEEKAYKAFNKATKSIWDDLKLNDYPKESLKVEEYKGDFISWYKIKSEDYKVYVTISVRSYALL